MKYVALVYLALGAGCILPIATGAPLPATTVGKGNVGFAMSGEAPTLDLIADKDNQSAGTNDPIAYGAAPAAAATLTFSYGLTDDTDVEVAGEGALAYFILPMPTGASIGARQHFPAGDSLDFAIAGRLGYVGSSATVTDSNGNKTESGAKANYGALQLILQTKRGFARPMLAVNWMPSHIKRAPSDEPAFSFNGMASSITLGLQLVGEHAVFGPYVAATNFYSDKFDNSGWFISGGLMFGLRPDRNRPRIEIPTAPPATYPPPSGPDAPPSGPYPPSYPPPGPPPGAPPGPAPAPTPTPPPPSPTTAPMQMRR